MTLEEKLKWIEETLIQHDDTLREITGLSAHMDTNGATPGQKVQIRIERLECQVGELRELAGLPKVERHDLTREALGGEQIN